MQPRAARIEALRGRLEARPEVLEAYLFGSAGRGEERPQSDLDVAVYLDLERVPATSFGYAAELVGELAATLATDAVDVVVLNDAPPLLYHRVLRDGERLLSRDLRSTTGREGRALSRYCDYLPQLAKIDAGHARRVESGHFGR